MFELTKEQIEQAIQAAAKASGWMLDSRTHNAWVLCMIAAAPFLASPWEMPTLEEITEAAEVANLNGPFWICGVLRHFVQRRNAALLPKPVDPREDLAIEWMQRSRPNWGDDLRPFAKSLLAALDKVKQ
jgi:hypothetical protein